jgi:uncharacterized protein (DUF433 family)
MKNILPENLLPQFRKRRVSTPQTVLNIVVTSTKSLSGGLLIQYLLRVSALEEVKLVFLPKLTPREKAELLGLLERDTARVFPGIERTAGVCGGRACIAGTRIPVWGLEEARRQGGTEAQLLLSYPGLRAEDLAQAWAYVQTHADEIDQDLRENAQA